MQAGDRVFDAAARTQQLVNTLNAMIKVNPQKAQAMSQDPEYRQALALNPLLTNAARAIAALSREKTRLANSRTIPPLQKREAMRRLYLQEIQILRNVGSLTQEAGLS